MDEFKNESAEILDNEEVKEEMPEEIKYAEAFVLNEEELIDEPEKKPWIKELYEWTQAIALAVVLALFINQFVFSIVQVEGHSMDPTLNHKQRLIVNRLFYTPDSGDIVIVKSNVLKKYIVKRVIALPGQVIDIDPISGDVTVDGALLDEPYIKEKLRSSGGAYDYPLTVPEDTVFVMGDNRNNSQDSRSIGVIPYDELIGKAVFRILPISEFGGLYKDLK